MDNPVDKLALDAGRSLQKRGFKLVTAESCTGGGLAYFITEIPGSSVWFEQGMVTYSNRSKETLLGVRLDTLNRYGAVSAETATEMAEGALGRSEAEVSIAITGIAGPDGGTPEKPVGTVWFGWAGHHADTITQLQHFTGDRHAVRLQSIRFALEGLIRFIKRRE